MKAPANVKNSANDEVRTIDTIVGHDVSITPEELVKHMQRVEAMTGILRDLLLAASAVPPFNMMITPQQLRELQAL